VQNIVNGPKRKPYEALASQAVQGEKVTWKQVPKAEKPYEALASQVVQGEKVTWKQVPKAENPYEALLGKHFRRDPILARRINPATQNEKHLRKSRQQALS